MTFPPDYAERVYAGVLGKIIGVYLGRPFEGWTHEQIVANLGEIKYYVNDRQDLPLRNHQLVITDDDISGTITLSKIEASYGGVAWEIPQSTRHFYGSKMAFLRLIPARAR